MEMLTKELRKKWALVIADRPKSLGPVVVHASAPVLDGAIWAWLARDEDLGRIEWGHFGWAYWVLDQMGSPAV